MAFHKIIDECAGTVARKNEALWQQRTKAASGR